MKAIEATLLTRRITAGAKFWMLGAGFKPVEEEVSVGDWIVDLAGYIYPTNTEMKTSLKLHKLIDAPPYTSENDRLTIFFSKYGMPLTAICEVKVSAADYRSDLDRKYKINHHHSHPGHLAYLAFPKGMVEEKELPWYWGHLIFSANGDKLLKVKPPAYIKCPTSLSDHSVDCCYWRALFQ